MDITEPENVEKWAVQTFGTADCGDLRRTDRLIKIASAMAKDPSASFPQAMETWGQTLGAYRFLENPAISYEQIAIPHWSATYQEALRHPRLLLLADTTMIDYSTHPCTKGLAPIGNSRKDVGYSLHTVLAMDPQTQRLLGCLTQEPFLRKLAPEKETKAEHLQRERESQVWERSVHHLGAVPANHQWIYVGDSGSDISTFWQTCQDLGYDFVLRVCQDRVVEVAEEETAEHLKRTYLKTLARALPAKAVQVLSLPAHDHHPKRDALLQISFQKVEVQAPTDGVYLRKTPLTAWVVRVWEEQPPQGQEPMEWILLTTLPITCPQEAWEVAKWYGWRWILEDFHKALKTGCGIQQRGFQDVEALWKVVAILTPIALRLLLLRQAAQQETDTPASEVISQEIIRLVIYLDIRHRVIVTAKQLWHAIARLGGYLDRKSDGPPGWQSLWRGWMRVMHTLEGVHFALHFSSP